MADSRFTRALEVDAIELGSIGSTVAILSGNDNLHSVGVDVPIGSLYLHNNGRVFRKASGSVTDWQEFSNSTGLAGAVGVSSNYTVGGPVIVAVDSTLQAVNVTMPLGSENINRVFYIKWAAGTKNNKVQLVPTGTDTIDGYTVYPLGNLMATAVLVGHINGWWLI